MAFSLRHLVESCERNWNGIRQVGGFASGWDLVNGTQKEMTINEMMSLMTRQKGNIQGIINLGMERRKRPNIGRISIRKYVMGLKEMVTLCLGLLIKIVTLIHALGLWG